MDNLNAPAYPVIVSNDKNNINNAHQIGNYEFQEHGFTKLEYAAIMIASGMDIFNYDGSADEMWIAQKSVAIAKAVLEEANK